MTNQLAQWFADTLGGSVSPYLVIFIVSMIPILELRGGLIVASLLHVNLWQALPICIVANLIPIPFILLLINQIFAWMKKTRAFGSLVTWLENKTMGKSDALNKGEFLGLMLFVGIPLPGTGAWTGSLLAALLHVDRKKAITAEFLGLLLAAAIMSVVSYGLLGQIW